MRNYANTLNYRAVVANARCRKAQALLHAYLISLSMIYDDLLASDKSATRDTQKALEDRLYNPCKSQGNLSTKFLTADLIIIDI